MPAALRLLLGAFWLSATGVSARFSENPEIDHRRDFAEPVQPRQSDEASDARQSLITFADPRAKAFKVDGKKIPDGELNLLACLWDLPFLTGVWGSALGRRTFLGGPDADFRGRERDAQVVLLENGPISWSWGQAEPTPNPWSWTQLSNMLWVEQPVGTGFSQGEPTINDDNALAAQVAGFLEQFLDIFSELKGSNFWVTGESYAGFFVPYIANYLYENPNPDLSLKGIWMADPSLTWDLVRTCRTHAASPTTSTATVDPVTRIVGVRPECKIHDMILSAAQMKGAPLTTYHRERPRLAAVDAEIHLLQSVQTAINAPTMHWKTCNHAVYADPETGELSEVDPSVPSALSVLPNVIEKSERVVIVHGLADFVLLPEGTRILIQWVSARFILCGGGVTFMMIIIFRFMSCRNMTWNGRQGFQWPIEEESFLIDDMGVFGHMHTERGLTYVEMFYSGHMAPQFVPWATYQTMAYVLGKRDSPSA
uniref:Carboxypeptidase n=1 Tax=Ganoderma boninense TaxID=34458 RepID=A0A5K1JYD7_9APHY|nr:Uncharacterized protein [Ganoderma boninense]